MHDDSEMVTRYLAGRNLPCPRCGFNLRGVPGAACPECGRRLGLSMLLLHENHAIPRAGKRVADARGRLRSAAIGLAVLALSVGVMSFPSITGLITAAGLLALACVLEGLWRWYRGRLDEQAMYESLATAAIDRFALAAAVLIAIPAAIAAMSLVAWILVRVLGD